MLDKTNKPVSAYLYIVRLIAVITFLTIFIIIDNFMESPSLYIPALIAWGMLSYSAIMILRGEQRPVLFLAASYAVLSAMQGCVFLVSVGFLSSSERGAYIGALWQALFMEVALLFSLTLLVAYWKITANRGGVMAGFAWVLTGGTAIIGVTVSLPVQALSFTLVSVSTPFTLFALVCMFLGLVCRKRVLITVAALLFLLAGGIAGAALLQDYVQKQYLYVIVSNITLTLLAFVLSTAPPIKRTRKS